MIDLTDLPALLTTREVAAILRVHRTTVHRWIQEGHLKAHRLGLRRCYRIERSDLARLIERSSDF